MTRRHEDWAAEDLRPVMKDLLAQPGVTAAAAAARFEVTDSHAVFWLARLEAAGYAARFHVGPGRRPATAWRWFPARAGQVLSGKAATPPVHRLVNLAWAGQLDPQLDPRVHHGSYRVVLEGRGRGAPFGAMRISERKGTFLRATLMHGRDGDEIRYDKVAGFERDLMSWLAVVWGRR